MSATQLYYTLIWPKEPPPLVDHLLRDFILAVEGWRNEAIWFTKWNDPEAYAQLTDVLSDISADEDQRFLLAPAAFPLLTAARAFDLDSCKKLLKAFRNDVLLSRDDKQRASPGWSQLTDFVQFDNGQRRYSDLLGDSIIVDFDSDHCLRIEPESSVLCREPVPISAEDREAILKKLRAALSLIDKTSSTAGRLVRNVTRCIRIRQSVAEVTAAETDPRVIGEVRLHNPQRDNLTTIKLADALIHESLHNFLAMYELRHGSFVAYAQNPMIRPVSPWTGNPIPYNAFTHAVFIYFALFMFYRLLYPMLSNAPERAEVAEMMTKCSRGFRLVKLGDCLNLVGASPQWLHELYRKMSDEVNCHYGKNPTSELRAA